MPTNRKDISSALISVISNGAATLQNRVYAYATGIQNAYPYATLRPTGFSSQVADVLRDKRTYKFTLLLVHERLQEGQGSAAAYDVMRRLEDEVMTALDADNDLGLSSIVLYTNPSEGVITERDQHLVEEIQIEVNTSITISQ